MQGHPESPCFGEKHTNMILCELSLTPTVHKPCLYSGAIAGQRVVFMQQVDDFAIATPNKKTSDILLNLIDEQLSIPLKRQALVSIFSDIEVLQTRDLIKIDCHTHINKFPKKPPLTPNALQPSPSPLPPQSPLSSPMPLPSLQPLPPLLPLPSCLAVTNVAWW